MSDKTGLSHPELKPREQILAEPSRLVPQPYRDRCRKCGAVRQDAQLGLEPTPEQYVENMVAVFRDVRRVLRSDGTVWLNLGDSYASGDGIKASRPQRDNNGGLVNNRIDSRGEQSWTAGASTGVGVARRYGLKPKDLVGIPWRVAFALQADGWYLRSDIIWAKPNPMPESVTDRPTKAHEYLFLLTKSARYYFDADAVREADAGLPSGNGFIGRQGGSSDRYPEGLTGGGGSPERFVPGSGRNIRTVWTIATQPYPGAHFATFPPKLVEPCIKAGTSAKGVCPECGAPWERIVAERSGRPTFDPLAIADSGALPDGPGIHRNMGGRYQKWLDANPPETTGWQSTCRCEHDGGGWVPVPATVLDPFAGSGTTAMVAQSLSRRAVLIDLNADYLGQVMERNRAIPLGLGGTA